MDDVPRWNYLHIPRDVIPALRALDVTDDQIHQLLVQNPRRIFDRAKIPY
jgi:phosphotriesterase-related protein